MHNYLTNLALWKHKDFRVFYGLLAIDEDLSIMNDTKQQKAEEDAQHSKNLQNSSPADKLTAENKSINSEPSIPSARHNESESQENQASKANTAPSDLNIKEW